MAIELLGIKSWWDIINVLADIMTGKKIHLLNLEKTPLKHDCNLPSPVSSNVSLELFDVRPSRSCLGSVDNPPSLLKCAFVQFHKYSALKMIFLF